MVYYIRNDYNTVQYNRTLLSLCREICLLARHLHKTFTEYISQENINDSTEHGAKNPLQYKSEILNNNNVRLVFLWSMGRRGAFNGTHVVGFSGPGKTAVCRVHY